MVSAGAGWPAGRHGGGLGSSRRGVMRLASCNVLRCWYAASHNIACTPLPTSLHLGSSGFCRAATGAGGAGAAAGHQIGSRSARLHGGPHDLRKRGGQGSRLGAGAIRPGPASLWHKSRMPLGPQPPHPSFLQTHAEPERGCHAAHAGPGHLLRDAGGCRRSDCLQTGHVYMCSRVQDCRLRCKLLTNAGALG